MLQFSDPPMSPTLLLHLTHVVIASPHHHDRSEAVAWRELEVGSLSAKVLVFAYKSTTHWKHTIMEKQLLLGFITPKASVKQKEMSRELTLTICKATMQHKRFLLLTQAAKQSCVFHFYLPDNHLRRWSKSRTPAVAVRQGESNSRRRLNISN